MNPGACLRTFLGACCASWDPHVEGEARGSAVTPGEWDETAWVGAAWDTPGDARQKAAVRRDASPSLCCPVSTIHERPRISPPEEVPQQFGNLLQRGHRSRCLAWSKLSARWVSRGQQPPPGCSLGCPSLPPNRFFPPAPKIERCQGCHHAAVIPAFLGDTMLQQHKSLHQPTL